MFDLVIHSNGKLRFSPSVDTTLTLGTVRVLVGGVLEIGTPTNPIPADTTAELVFKDRAINLDLDPGQYGNGLQVFGELSLHGVAVSDTFVRLAQEPQAGDTTLFLEKPISGWQVGDRVVLPDTRQADPRPSRGYVSQTEYVVITSISAPGDSLGVTPLQHDHLGARDGSGNVDLLPHVGNVDRNIILRSENPDGVRGHTQKFHTAEIDIRYVLFQDLGRTTAETLDSTVFNPDGTVQKIGSNQAARYAIHTHHLTGPATPQANGYQFSLVGNVVDGGTGSHPFKWGLTIHGSHDGLIRDNIVLNYAGSGIVTEDGSESHNV